jgi:hypothetical protein
MFITPIAFLFSSSVQSFFRLIDLINSLRKSAIRCFSMFSSRSLAQNSSHCFLHSSSFLIMLSTVTPSGCSFSHCRKSAQHFPAFLPFHHDLKVPPLMFSFRVPLRHEVNVLLII